jgi:adenylate kinase
MRLILFGAPGVGKGTQARILAETYQLPHLATGDMLRSAIAEKTPVGLQIAPILSAGQLVSDEIMIAMIKERLERPDAKRGFILDGFPRTLAQAQALDTLLQQCHLNLDAVIELKADAASILERLAGRLTCKTCGASFHPHHNPPKVAGTCDACGSTEIAVRDDDKPETIIRRLESYEAQTAPVLPYYKARGILASINAVQDVQTVSQQIKQLLAKAA